MIKQTKYRVVGFLSSSLAILLSSWLAIKNYGITMWIIMIVVGIVASVPGAIAISYMKKRNQRASQ